MENILSGWAVIGISSLVIGIFFGLMGFFFSDPNEMFRNVGKQISAMSAVGGAVIGILTLLFLYKGAKLGGFDFTISLLLGMALCSLAGFITMCCGRKFYFLINPVSPDERLRPPRN